MKQLERQIKQLNLRNIGHTFDYELKNICRIFFPLASVMTEDEAKGEGEITAVMEGDHLSVTVEFGTVKEKLTDVAKDDQELAISRLLFRVLAELTGYHPKWGMLTGIRPIKLFHKAKAKGLTDQQVVEYFKRVYLTHEEIGKLCLLTAKNEKSIHELSVKESYSLYIGIPFCPTRCSYCSFVSSTVKASQKLITPYVEKLMDELAEYAQIADDLGLRLETIYMGGGTPTTLSAEEMKKILDCVKKNFDLSHLREFTIEAGRPDTITAEKLQVIHDAGIKRISINPQTLSDQVLAQVGRTHTGQDVIDCYHLARKIGFESINMDLIAGLPEDTLESFQYSVDRLIALGAENITIHTLTIKRSSDIYEQCSCIEETAEHLTTMMVEYGRNALLKADYEPYYLYRQKNTIANLENIGYCKRGYECLYNVYIMDETHSIFSAGAGGVTKLRRFGGNDILRIRNFKYAQEYITQFDELSKRKTAIRDFYQQ